MEFEGFFNSLSLTSEQSNALANLESFLIGNANVFILNGYAGTGKTTLLKGIIDYLKSRGKSFDVMAPTGRAAKILKEKTGLGQTIHKTIYDFEDLVTIKKSQHTDDYSFKYLFPIKQEGNEGRILIVDEASMISSRESKNELFSFGTDVLLDDLLTYSSIPALKNKIIFVGDDAQLPPVGDNRSKALDSDYFQGLGLQVVESKLKDVVRQDRNLILENTFRIRSLIGNTNRSQLELEFDEETFIKTSATDIPELYVDKFPSPEIGDGVVITFSNAQCYQYNRNIRSLLHPKKEELVTGDLLIINHNNYHTYGVELMNGELAQVVHVDTSVEKITNIPVYETIKTKRVKKYVNLTFREIRIRIPSYQNEVKCLIIDSLLNSPNRDLTVTEMKALYINFVMRFNEQQKQREASGLPTYKVGSEEFKNQLRNDKYYNALRVKYGYAITCHKSQGGEWGVNFVDYQGRTGISDDPLRWSYTATTRAVLSCFAANAPSFSPFKKFTIGDVLHFSSIPADALDLSSIPTSPFHTDNHHRGKSLKYYEVANLLENTDFQIQAVQSLGGYQERYTISMGDEAGLFDAHHNEAGLFNEFHVVNPGKFIWENELVEKLNNAPAISFSIGYQPSEKILENLFSVVSGIIPELKIGLTNVIERKEKYYVIYFFRTQAKCALIQFYFNGKGQLTKALPKSTLGSDDTMLSQLIQMIQSNVI